MARRRAGREPWSMTTFPHDDPQQVHPQVGGSGNDDVVRLAGVTKRYGGKSAATTALNDVTLSFERGSFTAVMGPSGSGKSTLLHCAAGLARPTAGTVTLDGTDLTSRPERALAKIRR